MEENLIDLGLPSGTLWAKCNLGAEKETDPGLFYQWGDTEGHRTSRRGYTFNWNTYKYGTSWDNITKYNESDKTVLDNEDDPVYVATDGKMKSPTKEQLEELRGYTNHEWTEIDGVKGMKLINKNDSTKYIFIPAAGFCSSSYRYRVNSWGFVWSSSRYSDSPNIAWYMYCYSGNVGTDFDLRCGGFCVRGVLNTESK